MNTLKDTSVSWCAYCVTTPLFRVFDFKTSPHLTDLYKQKRCDRDMPPPNKLFLKDFVLPASNEGRYRDLLQWVDQEKRHFKLQWSHKSAGHWTLADSAVFQDWDKMKGRYNPDEKNY
ncbi:hypothetical protein JTE90_018948 [Oedothorax gibbosus]|uniref:IRF tryptophan pentad repeat domain-containing protein n=1 Tax=Oedothorax gibbosus TaxID=931172 RepID=A0AAV6TJB1_9ARAC|nr:hypothetical protein JTE90_018948 [Oedothorax gibbosus]